MEASAEARALTDQANQWVAQYKQCIEAVFLDYVHSGVWPRVGEFQQRLHVAGSDLDLWSFVDALRYQRRWLGWVDPPEERIELREVPNVTNVYNTTINSAAMVNVGAETVNVIQSQIQAIATSDPAYASRRSSANGTGSRGSAVLLRPWQVWLRSSSKPGITPCR